MSQPFTTEQLWQIERAGMAEQDRLFWAAKAGHYPPPLRLTFPPAQQPKPEEPACEQPTS